MRKLVIATIALGFLSLGACDKEAPEAAAQTADEETKTTAKDAPRPIPQSLTYVDPGAKVPQPVQQAIAVLHPTEGNEVRGTVRFESIEGDRVRVQTEVSNLPPGPHGYHVHLLGDCSGPDAETAGTHFNFKGPSKNPPADIGRITGNLGDLVPGKDGNVTVTATIDDASLQGRYSILGRAVVIHAQGNDPTKPPIGGAGARLACGVIGIDEATP